MRPRTRKAIRALGERLPENWQKTIVSFGEAVNLVAEEYRDVRRDLDAETWTVGVWIRGIARSDFDKLAAVMEPHRVASAEWDPPGHEYLQDLAKIGSNRRIAFFAFTHQAGTPYRAAVRVGQWLNEMIGKVDIGPVEGVRVEVEDESRLLEHVYLA